MKKEQSDDTTLDSMYETDTSTIVPPAKTKTRMTTDGIIDHRESARDPPKKAKKSLENSWNNSDLPYIIETPVSEKLTFNLL